MSAPLAFPWRSARLGWLACAALLVAGGPLFLRMPLWIDITLYDLAARAVLSGGMHYRDVFDTNPPGFVWCLCVVRLLFGPSMAALRAVDLVVVGTIAVLLVRWVKQAGGTAATAAWTAAGIAGFYLFISEFNHCQRDVWMMLPAIAATRMRLARQIAPRVFRSAIVEGMLWGLGVWIKPHLILIAAAAWTFTAVSLLARVEPRAALRRAGADLAGSILGGLAIGAAGMTWLLATGTWPHLYDVFTNWNTSYLSRVFEEFPDRVEVQFTYFPPWSLFFAAAVPLALLNVPETIPRIARRLPAVFQWFAPETDPESRFARGLLAVLYLAWAAVALLFQKQYHYVHVPETLLMIAVFAANRWCLAFPILVLQAGVLIWLALAHPSLPHWEDQPLAVRCVLWQYPHESPDRFQWWSACFERRVPGAVRNGLAFQTDMHSGTDWEELEEVETFLRSQGVKAGDASVLCWNDSPHTLYLMMDLKPTIRFMHLSTAVGMGPAAPGRVRAELLAAPPQIRFVVSDLKRYALFFPPEAKVQMDEPGPDRLPPVLPEQSRAAFPLNQPALFRSAGGRGRYVVHRFIAVTGDIDVPGWSQP